MPWPPSPPPPVARPRDAAAAIEVTYEVLPHVMDLLDAMEPGAPLLHDDMFTTGLDAEPTEPSNVSNRTCYEGGDIEKGFAEADVVVEGEFVTKPIHQGYIEPHACVADTGQDGKTVIWCSSQGHFRVRSQTAAMLGWDTSRIKVIPAEIGGGFGGKTTIYLEPLAVELSARAGRPVKMVMSRDEVFRATGPTPGSVIRVRLGATNDGRITAAEARLVYESGAFPGVWAMLGCMCVVSPYKVENFRLEGLEVVVNKPVNAAYRAPSAPMAAFATDTLVDEIARRLGMDPIDLRLLNCPGKGDQAPYGPKWPLIGLRECLEAIRDSEHYRSEPAPGHGRGVASGFWFNIGEASSATVNLNENGTATVVTGSPDIGGSRASMALMAAEELGIDVHAIQPVVGDTEVVGFTDVTEGSRATFATGMAVVEACRDLKGQLRGRAAKMWDCDSDDVEWADGRATHRGGEHEALTLAAITAEAGRTGGPLGATASLNARGAGPAFSVQVTDVSVDDETGRVTVERYTTAQDAGTAIHPDYVEGQMQGGVVQGIGWALNEEYIHDADGVMENPGFLDYRIPVASDLPMIETIIVEVPNPQPPLRRARRRRGWHRAADSRPGQRHPRRRRRTHPGAADVAAPGAGGHHVRQRRRGLMAQVHFSSAQRRLTGGVAEVDVEAATVRELLRKLEELFPGIKAHLDQTSATAVAIDGDIIPDPMYEPVPPGAEVHFITPLAGG